MKNALVMLRDNSLIEVEYDDVECIMMELNSGPFVTFDKRTFACDTIARIEWID